MIEQGKQGTRRNRSQATGSREGSSKSYPQRGSTREALMGLRAELSQAISEVETTEKVRYDPERGIIQGRQTAADPTKMRYSSIAYPDPYVQTNPNRLVDRKNADIQLSMMPRTGYIQPDPRFKKLKDMNMDEIRKLPVGLPGRGLVCKMYGYVQ